MKVREALTAVKWPNVIACGLAIVGIILSGFAVYALFLGAFLLAYIVKDEMAEEDARRDRG